MIFSGSAEPSWLRRGMLVRFTGEFDKKGKPQAPVTELEVFNLREGYQLGVFPEERTGVDTGDLFTNNTTEKKKKKKRTRAPQTGKYLVSGRLTVLKGNKLGMSAGGALVQAELAEKVRIAVSLNDIRYIQEGDSVEVDAWYPEGQKANARAIANRLTITASKPLTGQVKRPRASKSNRYEAEAEKVEKKKEAEKKNVKKEQRTTITLVHVY